LCALQETTGAPGTEDAHKIRHSALVQLATERRRW